MKYENFNDYDKLKEVVCQFVFQKDKWGKDSWDSCYASNFDDEIVDDIKRGKRFLVELEEKLAELETIIAERERLLALPADKAKRELLQQAEELKLLEKNLRARERKLNNAFADLEEEAKTILGEAQGKAKTILGEARTAASAAAAEMLKEHEDKEKDIKHEERRLQKLRHALADQEAALDAKAAKLAIASTAARILGDDPELRQLEI